MSLQQLVQDMIELRPTLYYATQENMECGKAYHAAETKFSPECIVCHPDDLEKIRAWGWTLVHLREWRPLRTVVASARLERRSQCQPKNKPNS